MARELASHLRLKRGGGEGAGPERGRGEGTGFSSEIETLIRVAPTNTRPAWWRGNWLLI